jgi:hypothetical protein
MPIFVYRCECAECGSATRKIPAGPSIGRAAGTKGAPGDVAVPWRGTVSKGAEGMQREVKLRENIVTKGREYPGNPGSTAAAPSKD